MDIEVRRLPEALGAEVRGWLPGRECDATSHERILQALPLVSCGLIVLVGLFLCYQAYDPGLAGLKSSLSSFFQ